MNNLDRKAWEKQQRENRIVDMAEPVFFEKGYEGTTIIEIARASGYNKRSIYLYFRDKEEIFLAVVLRGLARLHDMLAAAGSLDVRDLGRAFFEFSLSHPDYLKLIMVYEASLCVYQGGRPGAVTSPNSASAAGPMPGADDRGGYREKCQAKTDAIAALITRRLETAIAENQIRTRLAAEQLMLILWGQVFGVMQIILMRQEGFEDTYGISYKDLFDAFLDMAEVSLSVDADTPD